MVAKDEEKRMRKSPSVTLRHRSQSTSACLESFIELCGDMFKGQDKRGTCSTEVLNPFSEMDQQNG